MMADESRQLAGSKRRHSQPKEVGVPLTSPLLGKPEPEVVPVTAAAAEEPPVASPVHQIAGKNVDEDDSDEDGDEEDSESEDGEEEDSESEDEADHEGPGGEVSDEMLIAIAKGEQKFDHGNCVAAAIAKGYIKFNGTVEELDSPLVFRKRTLVFEDRSCCDCSHEIRPTLRQLLRQPDYGGDDYEDGLNETTVRCEVKHCEGRCYVTSLCKGTPDSDDGKFHNHCFQCPGRGVCLGDYREAHCRTCNTHYWGSHGCPRCERGDRRDVY